MPALPTLSDVAWTNPPPTHALGAGVLTSTTARETDFWQRTHYGFRRDDGHIFGAEVAGDVALTARVITEPNAQYDQAGPIARAGWGQAQVLRRVRGRRPQPARLGRPLRGAWTGQLRTWPPSATYGTGSTVAATTFGCRGWRTA